MKNWTAEPCDWEGTKIVEQGEQVAAISMATPEALALMLAAPLLLDALKHAEERLRDIPHDYGATHFGTIADAIEAAEDSAPWEAADEFDREGEA